MTEASENAYLVRVRAQVMCRDEGTGGWVALGGGGLADVMVGRRPAVLHHTRAHTPHSGSDSNGDTSSCGNTPIHEYFIHGKRISDNMVVLECTIKKDFQYNKVMPTFHHWVTDEKRFGLTFQTAADARAFDKGVRTAIEELLDGLGGAWPSLHAYKKHNPAPKDDDEENNIFECLNLPSESRSSSENSSASRVRRAPLATPAPTPAPTPVPVLVPATSAAPPTPDLTQTPILSAITLPAHAHPLAESLTQYEVQYDDKLGVDEDQERCRYVHLSAVHEYSYPQVGSGGIISSEKTSPHTKQPQLKRNSGCVSPPLPDKKPPEPFQARLKCRYCNEWYLESANRAGSCYEAPDCFRTCRDRLSCISCAQGMVYHCLAREDDVLVHPCACCVPPTRRCAKRWVGLTLLSFLVPCLWCYPPLTCAYKAARAVRLAGGVHSPIRN